MRKFDTQDYVTVACAFLTISVGAWVSYEIANRQSPGAIEVHEDMTIPLLSAPMIPDMKLTFQGQEIEDPGVTEVTIVNTGGQAIAAEDFAQPITFRPQGNEKIRAIAMPNSATSQLAFTPQADGSYVLNPRLMNPGDSFTFAIIFSNAPSTLPPSIFRWGMKIKNVTHISYYDSDVQSSLTPKSILDVLSPYLPQSLRFYIYHDPAEVWMMFVLFVLLEAATLWLLVKSSLLRFPVVGGIALFFILQFAIYCDCDNIACLFHTGTQKNSPIAYLVLWVHFAVSMALLAFILFRKPKVHRRG